ncbi:MAG TPA: hypothetical protein VM911_10915 [Pyrinomonadaceae bacterium]|jgi:hypothetical protein|nr:hypothetical protein [Pyrinomonadaceae bacterium]
MKLPFDFGIKLIFRLLIPGFFLSLGFLPLLNTILDIGGWAGKFEYIYVLVVIFMGWLIIISDMNIYMLMEGRRFWPDRLRKFFIKREKRKLAGILRTTKIVESEKFKHREENSFRRLEQRIDKLTLPSFKRYFLKRARKKIVGDLEADDRRVDEAYFDLRTFPMSDEGDYVVQFPTRLGNVLAAYENYSLRVYGVDSIFYWWRIWLKVDKDTREEIDNSQAIADSTVYTSFALFFTGAIWLIHAILFTLQLIITEYLPVFKIILPTYRVTISEHAPTIRITWILSLIFLSAGFIVYRLSIRLHAQFGELFKSLFDVYEYKINVSGIMKEVSTLSASSPYVALNPKLARKEQLKVVTRYLQYYRYRCPRCNKLMKPNEIASHTC